MSASNSANSPGLGTLVGRIIQTALRGVHTRAELLAVEMQEERLRVADLLLYAMALLLLSTLGLLLLTLTIIFLVPTDARVYVMAGFALLYLAGAAGVWFALRSMLSREPFAESLEQVRKDRVWLELLK